MSLIFYAWGEPRYVFIMLFSTIVDYVHGILVENFIKKEMTKRAKVTLASSMIINLGILGFFKYFDMIVKTVNNISGSNLDLLEIALPIGVSFYTFQTMSYTIDVYRGKVKAQRNIISFGTYVTMFPQLIAGPIVRYKDISDELNNRKENIDLFADGIRRFVIGLGKKVLFANNIGILWNTVKSMNIAELPMLTAWLGAAAFTLQIYFDFSGYSDMAIGLGKMFGFNFGENFNYPYISKSITEFWRRWHISLSTWFKEYVYIPLGGSHNGRMRTYRNIFIVWLLTGLWHGARYNFVFWGLYFCIILIAEKLFLGKLLEKCPKVLRHLYALILIAIGWIIFSFGSAEHILKFVAAMFGTNGLADGKSIYLVLTNALLLLVLGIAATNIPRNLIQKLSSRIKSEAVKAVVESAFYAVVFLMSVAYLVDATYNPFLYFRF